MDRRIRFAWLYALRRLTLTHLGVWLTAGSRSGRSPGCASDVRERTSAGQAVCRAPRRWGENQMRTVGAVAFDWGVTIVLSRPGVDGLGEAAGALREWQHDGAPMQLHPGDLGWFWRFGADATPAAVRTWSRDGQILAAGLLDEPTLLRLSIAPDAHQDEDLAHRVVEDVTEPKRAVLTGRRVGVEAPEGGLVQDLLIEDGWKADEPRTPLCRDLTDPVEDPGVRIEVIGPPQARVRAAVQREAFERSTFTNERWDTMAAGLPYADARCLVAYEDQGNAVAAVTVWSAGPGKPGLIEPMGVHQTSRSWLRHGNHRRRGGRTPGAGLVERDRRHPERQRRRRCHVHVSRLPPTP
ncbi:MAG: hypothetical protein JWO11_2090 [Nocardioides sp.]|nr:hypothetical protein [Nocardioides sp.]